MKRFDDIPVVFENGVFRPESPVDIPEHARLVIRVQDEQVGPRGPHVPGSLKAELDALRARNLIRPGPWRPTREELHERG